VVRVASLKACIFAGYFRAVLAQANRILNIRFQGGRSQDADLDGRLTPILLATPFSSPRAAWPGSLQQFSRAPKSAFLSPIVAPPLPY
jgi:hypothetical protein